MTSVNIPFSRDHLHQQLPPLSEEEAEVLRQSEEQKQLQPDINIGMIGHVAHGKTSLVRAISGILTTKFSGEKRMNKTVVLGYANFKIFKCSNLLCPPPICYQSFGGQIKDPKCSKCDSEMKLVRHISFVDCPGHEMLMRTMLNGASVMDSAILVVATNEFIPQPQTAEHLVVAEIMGLKEIITVQNKCDLVPLPSALKSKDAIVKFLSGTVAEQSPIIPMSCAPNFLCNVDVLLQYLVEKVPYPLRELTAPPLMRIIRSFDVNKPGTPLAKVKGGVCGGTLSRGVIRVGELIEIRPGLVGEIQGKHTATPIRTRVVSLYSEAHSLKTALPGGLIGVGTLLDPTLSRQDRLVGQVVGRVGELPPVFSSLEIKFQLMKRIVGETSERKVVKPAEGEMMFLTIGSAGIAGKVTEVKKNHKVRVALNFPVCAEIGDKVSLSRNFERRWRLIGWGEIVAAKLLTITEGN